MAVNYTELEEQPLPDATWQRIVEAEPSPICAFDHEFRLTAFNTAHSDQFFEIYAHRVQVGEVFPDLFLPDQAPVIQGFMARALAGETFEVIQEFGNPDLSKPFWAISYAPLRNDAGHIVGAFHRARDISVRLRSEAELAAAKQALQETRLLDRHLSRTLALFDDQVRGWNDVEAISTLAATIVGRTLGAVRVGFATLCPDRKRVEVLRGWVAPGVSALSSGYPLADFGDYLDSLATGEDLVVDDVATDSRTTHRIAAWDALGSRSVVNVPVLADGALTGIFFVLGAEPKPWLRAEIEFIRNVGNRVRVYSERLSIEEQHRATAAALSKEIEIRTSELDQVWALSQDCLLITDAQGQWLRVSPAWSRLLGWSDSELLGRTSGWLMHPDDLSAGAGLAHGPVKSITTRLENRLRTKDGSYRWFSWSSVPHDGRVYSAARDVTEEKELGAQRDHLEEQLRQSQKMEAVGQLTGGLAHDLNNLLTGITGSLDMLNIRMQQGRFGEIDRYVHASQGAAKRAAALTHRLLAFSRRQTLDPKPTDANRLVIGMSELLQRTIGPAIELETVAAAGLWTTIVDPGQLENALLNLCINARDAMPGGGKLTIETGNKWVDARTARERDISPGQYVTVRVSDTGSGMAPEVAVRAFDPFFTTKPIGMGTGLGLSMVYGFARQSGGQAHICSEIDKGTVICLYFPRYLGESSQAAEEATKTGVIASEHSESVLVVDDEPTVRMLVVEVLQEMGFLALEAQDGSAALKILNSGAKIDLLITDVGLPGGMNGRQVADAARQRRADLEILFITGYAATAVLNHEHLDAGMHVLTKPFTVEDLMRRVKGLVANAQ